MKRFKWQYFFIALAMIPGLFILLGLGLFLFGGSLLGDEPERIQFVNRSPYPVMIIGAGPSGMKMDSRLLLNDSHYLITAHGRNMAYLPADMPYLDWDLLDPDSDESYTLLIVHLDALVRKDSVIELGRIKLAGRKLAQRGYQIDWTGPIDSLPPSLRDGSAGN